jgi:signal transduction histidine kinase
MMGKHFLDFVGSSEKPNVAKAFGRLLKSSRLISFEASLTTKYGKTQSFVINARSTFKNEQLDSVLGIATDITSQKEDNKRIDDLNNKLLEASRIILIERDRAKQKITVLEELNKMKSEFVSNISHELRTPLASMIGFAETIDSDPDMPPDMRKEFNQIILNESKRLSKLIDNVLDISKLEGGKIVLEKRKFSITEGLNQVIDRAGKEAKMKSLVFSAELPQEEVYIYADPTRIEQLFENILNNALKFTPQGGRISVFAQSLYNEFEVIISDTGIGIPKDDLPFIFQKFYRVSRKDKNIPGPGLGLSIVKQIIDMHKGMITIRSEEKKGTTVVVKLPIIKQK